MAQKLIRHGSRAGYEAELAAGGSENVCPRCRAGKRVYQSQYTKANKAKGIKYSSDQVIDHLDKSTRPSQRSTVPRPSATSGSVQTDARQPTASPGPIADSSESDSDTTAQSQAGPSLADRLNAGIRGMMTDNSDYVDEEAPEYLHAIDPDPEPGEGEWSEVADEQFVINAAGMAKIEDSLGTYLSIVGMTVEMVDPYCGPTIAANMENMVQRWAKVIAHYPKAAALFLDTKGGTIMAWIGALQATWPVLYAVYEHHLSKSVKVEDGRLYRKSGMNGQAAYPDPTMPPMRDSYNYTAE